MAKKELYEILSKTSRIKRSYMNSTSDVPTKESKEKLEEKETVISEFKEINTDKANVKKAKKDKPKLKSTTDLVITLESGITVFFVILILISTSFYLGYKRGSSDILLTLDAKIVSDNNLDHGEIKDIKYSKGFAEVRQNSAKLPAGAYVLRLVSYDKSGPGLTRAKGDIDFSRRQKIVYQEGMTVFLIANSAAYSVCIGPVSNRYDARLEKVKRKFKRYKGPPSSRENTPYAAASVEKVDKLGRVVQC